MEVLKVNYLGVFLTCAAVGKIGLPCATHSLCASPCASSSTQTATRASVAMDDTVILTENDSYDSKITVYIPKE
jgi:hypothetical protein